MFKDISIKEFDPVLAEAMAAESVRQENHIELIASENYCSQAVMEAQGTDLTNKYAEGYPGKRYYGGCEHVDVVEQLAIDRAKEFCETVDVFMAAGNHEFSLYVGEAWEDEAYRNQSLALVFQ